MVTKWPEGMDKKAITQETETSHLWTEYAEIRHQSIRKHGDIRDATAFYEQHPSGAVASSGHKEKIANSERGRTYTLGVRTLLDDLISRRYARADENNSELAIHLIAMDAQEGLISPIVRNVCRKYPPEKVIACHGFGIIGGRLGMETYTAHDDTTFEDMCNPSANARQWMFKFSKVARTYELHSDVNA